MYQYDNDVISEILSHCWSVPRKGLRALSLMVMQCLTEGYGPP